MSYDAKMPITPSPTTANNMGTRMPNSRFWTRKRSPRLNDTNALFCVEKIRINCGVSQEHEEEPPLTQKHELWGNEPND